jgi:hypothetical protein
MAQLPRLSRVFDCVIRLDEDFCRNAERFINRRHGVRPAIMPLVWLNSIFLCPTSKFFQGTHFVMMPFKKSEIEALTECPDQGAMEWLAHP